MTLPPRERPDPDKPITVTTDNGLLEWARHAGKVEVYCYNCKTNRALLLEPPGRGEPDEDSQEDPGYLHGDILCSWCHYILGVLRVSAEPATRSWEGPLDGDPR
jgi:hypothetical protein